MTVNYRDGYDFFACNGILFNHESPRRGETFVSRKITRAVARIVAGLQDKLHLGNLEAKRDWGYAPEYVEAMWMMMQQARPDDYVIATGESHSVREFVELAFEYVGLGDPSKARQKLGWEAKVRFADLVKLMLDADIKLLTDKLNGQFERERSIRWSD